VDGITLGSVADLQSDAMGATALSRRCQNLLRTPYGLFSKPYVNRKKSFAGQDFLKKSFGFRNAYIVCRIVL